MKVYAHSIARAFAVNMCEVDNIVHGISQNNHTSNGLSKISIQLFLKHSLSAEDSNGQPSRVSTGLVLFS
eukprot:5246719-Amphidinium_carterae.1